MAATKKSMQDRVVGRQLEITGKVLDAVERALCRGDQLFRYTEMVKGKECEAQLIEHTGDTLNEKRLFEITRALDVVFELQRLALGIPVFKEKSDAEMAKAKLNLEKKKFESKVSAAPAEDDGFLEAIAASLVNNE